MVMKKKITNSPPRSPNWRKEAVIKTSLDALRMVGLSKLEYVRRFTPSAEDKEQIISNVISITSVVDGMWIGCQLQKSQSHNAKVRLYIIMGHYLHFSLKKATRV